MKTTLLAATLLISLPCSVRADRSPEAVAVLEAAQEVAARLKSIEYEATILGEGSVAKRQSIIDAKVSIKRTEAPAGNKIRIEGTNTLPWNSRVIPFIFADDGQRACSLNEQLSTFFEGRSEDAWQNELDALSLEKHIGPQAYKEELEANSVTYEGIKKIDGVACHAVKVQYDKFGHKVVRFHFGEQDHLLRSMERLIVMGRPDVPPRGAVIVTAYNIKTDIDIDDSRFVLQCPQGFRRQLFPPRGRVYNRMPNFGGGPTSRTRANQYLAVGSDAPDWALQRSTGEKVTLKELRGKVVVLDFWASWCGPCKRAMPALQKLHNRFENKPVAIFGVNCRERNPRADPMAYIKRRGYTYGQLVNGDIVANAYKVRGIPTFYLIGKDGKILHATSGYSPTMESGITRIIEDALK